MGTKISAASDEAGGYSIEGVPQGEVLIRVEREGYAALVEKVRIGEAGIHRLDFRLQSAQHLLDELIVRARPSGDKETSIEAETLRADNNRSLGEVLNDVAGVQLIRPGGEIGTGTVLRIRGASSFLFSGPPVVYVDGVRVAGPGELGAGGLEDLVDLEDIERIEILHGPAALRYGSDVANGVILITTRRGSASR
jgi:TonB-dependent SusC/RagA subfamily outer membrane receptor